MDIHKILPLFVGNDLITAAKQLNYSESNILILQGEELKLKEKYPEVYNNLLSCKHNKDSRTYIEYGQDLIASWIFEDYIIATLKEQGINIHHAGADKQREILKGSKVSASSDSIVEYNGNSRLLEIMTDYTGYWNRTKKIDLRDLKFEKMKRSESLFLGISILDRKFLLIDFKADVKAKYTSFHYAYRKPAYQIEISSDLLQDYMPESIAQQIINKI